MQFNSEKPIYQQLFDLIQLDILEGKWPEGGRVPSVRELAGNLEVNPGTVMRAYEQLQEEAILFNQRGRGLFVADNAKELILKNQQKEMIQKEIPQFVKKMKQLQISLEEFVTVFNRS
ncbi:MAG: GntR family transcriptional regulator [Sphingobacterium sp.]